MAEALYLVSKTARGGEHVVNGVRTVLINADDGATGAVVRAAAATACNALVDYSDTGIPPFPSDYFDTSVIVSELTAGPLKDAGDAYVIGPNGPTKREGA